MLPISHSRNWMLGLLAVTTLAVIADHPTSAQTFAPAYDVTQDGSFTPRDRRLQSLLEQARSELLDADGDHREALRSLQQLIDDAEDVFTDATMTVSLRDESLRIIAALPDEARRLYDETFGAEASSLLGSADGDRSERRREVIRRYFHTSAGAEAAFREAVAEMDSGHFLSAGRMLDRLHTLHDRGSRFEPELSVRCVHCYWRAGETGLAATIVNEAAHRLPDIRIAGAKVPEFASADAAGAWLTEHIGTRPVPSSVSTADWVLPGGSPTRNTTVDSVSPLFDDAWSVPLIRDKDSDDPVQIEELATLLDGVAAAARDAGWRSIPALRPIAVRDLVVFPSYGLVKAADVHTGELRWVALPADQTFADVQTNSTSTRSGQLSGEMGEFLTQRAWLDATSSQISSDGRRVYAVRDSGMVGGLPQQYAIVAQADHPRRARPFNSLRAYDADGGRWMWEIGGARTRTSLPLAGTFFLGPPLAVDGTLYVLGEDLGQVRLHALLPTSGEVLWSLPLANSDADIEEDLDRRLAGLSPTLAGGLLICPTGSGLVVAVDPLMRTLVWGTRYREPKSALPLRGFRGGPFIGGMQPARAQATSVSELMQQPRWHEASVVAAGNSLLIAPPDVADPDDERRLLCLNLLDGSTRWQRDRQGSLYVAGVDDGTVLLIGDRLAEGVDLTNGKTVWTLPIPEPSGYGVRDQHLYHLPLASGEIATIDIATGRLRARSAVRSGHTLGNLIAAGGRLISQSAAEVRSFRPRSEVVDQIARDLATDPDNAAALAARGESRLHDGDTAAGLADLRAALVHNDDSRTRQLLATTLLEGLRSDFATYRQHVDELDRLAAEPELRSRFLMTYADGLLEQGEITAAFEQLLRMLDEVNDDAPLEYTDDGRLVRRDRHVLGQLARLYSSVDESARSELDDLLDRSLANVAEPDRDGLVRRLGSAIPRLRADSGTIRAVSGGAADELPTRIEARLFAARRRGSTDQQAIVAARLADLYVKHGRVEPVVQLLDELGTLWSETACLDGKTGAEWAAEERASKPVADLLSEAVAWPTGDITVREGAGDTMLFSPLRTEGPTDPFVSTFLYLPDNRGRVTIHDGYGRLVKGGILNLLPAGGTNLQSQYVMHRGHRAVLFLGTQFKLVDLLNGTPRVLLEDLLVDASPIDATGIRFNRRVIRQPGFRGQVLWSDDPGENGSIGPLNDAVLCYLRGSTLYAHDPFTGERYWAVEDAPHGAEIFADEDYVLLVPLGQNVAHVYRALDGEKLGARTLPADVVRNRRAADWGRFFLRITDDDHETGLAMYDPVTERNVWTRTISKPFEWAPRDGSDLCIVDEDGLMTLLDPLTGDVLQETHVEAPNGMIAISVLSLPDQWLLTTYRRPTADANAQLAQVQLTQTVFPVNGPVTAFDRRTGDVMWNRVIASQMITPDMPSRWPLLALSAVLQTTPRVEGQRVIPVLTRQIELISRQTGETVYSTTTDGNSRRLDVFWQVSENVPQLRLRYGLLELEVAFREAAPEAPAEPTETPPSPVDPAEIPPPPPQPKPADIGPNQQ